MQYSIHGNCFFKTSFQFRVDKASIESSDQIKVFKRKQKMNKIMIELMKKFGSGTVVIKFMLLKSQALLLWLHMQSNHVTIYKWSRKEAP